MKRSLIMAALMLAILGVAIAVAYKAHRTKEASGLLEQVSNAGTNQSAALRKLGNLGAAAVAVEVHALSQTGEVGWAAELALLNNPSATNVVPRILPLLENSKPEVRLQTAGIVMDQLANRIRPPDTAWLPALIKALEDTNALVREDMALALSKFGSAADAAVPALTRALDDGSPRVRITAAMALTKIDSSQNAAAIPVLKEVIANGNAKDRHWAAVYLHKIQPDDAELIPVFIGSLTNADRGIRISAAYSLLQYGSAAKMAVPALQQVLDDSNADMRRAAQEAIRQIDPEVLNRPNVQNQ
jgi:HEAT repeat protein